MKALLGMYMKSAGKGKGPVHWFDRAAFFNLATLCRSLEQWSDKPDVLVKWQRERELQADQGVGGRAVALAELWQGTRQFELNPFFGSTVSGTPGVPCSGPSGILTTKESLTDFVTAIRMAMVTSQSNRSAIMFWGHADGPGSILFNVISIFSYTRIAALFRLLGGGNGYQSISVDSPESARDVLELFEMDAALSSAELSTDNRKIDFFCFDACQDATIELAATLSLFGEIMVASQSSTPTAGWDYAAWPSALDASQHVSLDAAASEMLHAYSRLNYKKCVLSAVRLAKIPDVLLAIRTVSDQLLADWPRYHQALDGAVSACPPIPRSFNDKRDMSKLFTALGNYAGRVWGSADPLALACMALVDQIRLAVVSTTICEDSTTFGYGGISIYFPAANAERSPHAQRAYGPGTKDFGGFKLSTRWNEVVEKYKSAP
jgi:Clostripain family